MNPLQWLQLRKENGFSFGKKRKLEVELDLGTIWN